MALTASTILLYSRSNSPTSDTLRSSAVHSRKRGFGGEIRTATGEAARDDTGVSKRFGGCVDDGGLSRLSGSTPHDAKVGRMALLNTDQIRVAIVGSG